MNKVMLMGRIGQEPEMKMMPNGKAVLNLSVATSERWKDKDGNKQEKTEWHRIVAFGKQAEIISQYFKKGDQILVTDGQLTTRSWEDKEGNKKYMTEITLRAFEFVGGGSKSESKKGDSAPQTGEDEDVFSY